MQLFILIAILSTFVSTAEFPGIQLLAAEQQLDWTPLAIFAFGLPVIFGVLLFFKKPETDTSAKSSIPPINLSRIIGLTWFCNSIALVMLSNWPAKIESLNLSISSVNLLIALVPVLIPLGTIWFISSFYLTLSASKSWSEMICRTKVYILITLVPLLAILLIKDISNHFVAESSMLLQFVLLPVGLLAVAMIMPFAICWIFPTQSIKDTQLGSELVEIAERLNANIHDVRIWGTGNRIINAMVVGLFSWGRTVLITDRLIKEFELEEIKAVFMHELGHAKRHHLLQRLVAAAIPFFFTYAICQACELSELPTVLFAMATSIGGLAVMARLLEYDADQFAVDSLTKMGRDPNGYRQALMRMRYLNPAADNPSWLHPRITDRINRLANRRTIRVSDDAN